MKVVVDKREEMANGWVERVRMEGAEAEERWLVAGDFIVEGGGRTLLIERKSVSDLVSSVINKRLFKQLDLLSQQEIPFALMITGDPKELTRRFRASGRNPSLVWNVYFGIQNELGLAGVPVLVVPHKHMTPRMLYLLASKMEKGVRPVLRIDKRSRTMADEQVEVLGAVRNLGVVRAKALLSRFQTLRRIVTAGQDELMEVRGIGEKTAKHMIRVFSASHEEARKIGVGRKSTLA